MEKDFTKEQKYVLARKRVEKISKFYKHLASYVVVNMFLSAIFITGAINDGDSFYGNNNIQDVYNTQLQVVNDIVQSVRRGSLFDSKIQLIGEPSATPFKDRYENELAGWGVEINVSMINDISIC